MSKHTPGPWVETESVRPGHLITENGIVVARVFDASDARLISAAPDMAEALRDLLRMFSDHDDDALHALAYTEPETAEAIVNARAALKKSGVE